MMKTKIGYGLLVLFQLLLISVSSLAYAEAVPVKGILQNKEKYLNRIVEIEGVVDRWVEKAEKDKAGSCILRDDFGDTIEVQTVDTNPPVGKRCRVTGLLSKGPRRDRFYIQGRSILFAGNETEKTSEKSAEKPAVAEPNESAVGFVQKATGLAGRIYGLMGSVALVLLVVVVLVVVVKRRSHAPMLLESPIMSTDVTGTIRIDLEGNIVSGPEIDEKTQRLLIGYFEITDGMETARGQRLFIPGHFTQIGREESGKDKSKGWITFPSDYATVSRHQADLVFEEGNYVLVNHASVNATVVNGKRLGDGKKVRIKDGDHVSFGNIELTFRASR